MATIYKKNVDRILYSLHQRTVLWLLPCVALLTSLTIAISCGHCQWQCTSICYFRSASFKPVSRLQKQKSISTSQTDKSQ